MKPIQTLSLYPITTQIISQREASALVHIIRNQDLAMPEGTERQAGPKLAREKFVT